MRDALAELAECERLERDWEIRTPAYGTRRADAAELRGSRELAVAEVERCRTFGAAAPLGAALRTLGSLDGDHALLEQAVAVLEPSPARLEHALALLALGRAVRRVD